ncbi:hypothetical protein BUALT_Bualt02G0241700 [Buddleja alternifolia]|uniref:histidine kinase n=1 Tax=Buddleja alternifolia TaxID=168488 RepID=A0AAV6YDJ3_9LAMI|nr:hypothetical protein BUALT_Bualt02G0241700 [Buddleja alternifolia]
MALHLRNSRKFPLSASTPPNKFGAGNGGFFVELESPNHGQDTAASRGRGIQGKQVDGSSLPLYILLSSFTHSSSPHCTHYQVPFILPHPSSLCSLQKILPLVRQKNIILRSKPESLLYCLNKFRPFCKQVDSMRYDSELDSDAENESFDVANANFELDPKEVERVCKVIDETFALDRNMEAVLNECGVNLSHELILGVLDRFKHARKPAFRFFCWAGDRPGFAHDSRTYNAMMNVLGKTRQFETMVSVLEDMGEKNLLTIDTFTICIKAFAAAKERKKAVGVIDLMKKYKFKADVETINCLLDALGKAKLGKEAQLLYEKSEHKFTPNLRTYTILLNGWCKVKNLMEAGRTWNGMIDNGFKPDIITHNIMLEGLLRSKKKSDAIKLFEVMKSKGPLPNVRSYTILLKDLCKHGNMKEAVDYFDDMLDSGCGPDAALYTCLMSGFGNQKKMDMVYRLLKEMKEKGCVPDGHTYNALIKMMTSRHMPDDAVKIYKKMIQNGIEPSIHTYNMMMKSFFIARNYDMSFAVWEEMKSKGCCPDENSYSVFIGGLLRQGRLIEACKYLEEMIDKGMKAPQLDYDKFRGDFSRAGSPNILEELAQKMKFSGNFEVANLITRWMFVVLSLAGLLIPLWINRVGRIENDVKLIPNNINQELLSGIQKTSTLFSPFNSSSINLERVLSSSLGENELQFSKIQSKAASILFQALSTIPYLSQVSYIGLDGLFFSYYTKEDQPYALYSNSTFSAKQNNDTNNYTWYIQPANRDTGKLYGEALKSPSFALVNSSWFQAALNSTNGYASLGTVWGSTSQELLLLSTAAMNGKGIVSLGFSMKSFIDLLITETAFYNGSLYLATNDGNVLTQGAIPNTRMILADNQVSFQLLGHNDQVGAVGNITCQSRDATWKESIVSIWEKKYVIICSPVEIAGLELVYVLALPHNEYSSLIHKNIKLAFILIIVMIGAMVITICSFVYLIVEAARREMYLCGALINQMEATRQSERKSMNKSLAFASASHDIRASLAGITGLIDISRNEVSKRDPSRSELLTNLLQMEACTRDLLGILNSILDTTKIEAGKMQLEEEEFDMEQLLEDVVDLYHPVGMKKGVDVILDPYDGSITKSSRVKGDRGKLKQIMCNLLSNAVKFTSEGHVIVRAWARKPSLENEILASNRNNSMSCLMCLFKIEKAAFSESEVVNSIIQGDPNCMEFVFEVNDTGKGIPKEKQKSVFENYVQVKETALGQEGTGLGLGIVQSLVRLMGGEIGIVDKEVGERGTCFRFNVFFSTSETDISSSNARASDIETNLDYISSDSFQHSGPIIRIHSPKTEGSQVILFIQSAKRSSVLHHFMQRLGIKVHIVNQHEQFYPTLKRIKQKLNLSRYSSSGKSEANSRSDGPGSRASSARSKEVPLSALDGTDNILPSQKKANARGGFVLIVIDVGAGPIREISRAVAEFRTDLNDNFCSKVVWLDKQDPSSNNLLALDEDKLPPSDLVISKPFHGSRLYQTIGLLPEFRAMPPPRGDIRHNIERVSFRNISSLEASTSDETTKSGVKGQYSAESIGNQKGKTEEIEEPKSNKPLTGKKILVADDDVIGQKIAKSVASQLGANIYSCKDGKEAWELVCRSLSDGTNAGASNDFSLPFDCILMDCQMIEMNGIEATRRIREAEETYGVHIPIIALSAHEKGEEIDKMIQAGVDGYLTKPLNAEVFLKAISGLINRT